jgi:phosphoribosylanthranilate isomerase
MTTIPMTPLIKICGLTTIADVRVAASLGADFLGMIVDVPRSRRNLSLPVAQWLRPWMGDSAVLVTEDLALDRLVEVVAALQPAALQLHGREHPSFIASLRRALPRRVHLWKSLGLPMTAERREETVSDLLRDVKAYAHVGCSTIVLDTVGPAGTGGTGQTGDWTIAAEVVAMSPLPILLAGGIGPGNVAEALRMVRPAGVDLCSCVERAPGRKSAALVRELVERVKADEG